MNIYDGVMYKCDRWMMIVRICLLFTAIYSFVMSLPLFFIQVIVLHSLQNGSGR